MIEGQEVVERTQSPAFSYRSTNTGSFRTDTYGCIFHSFSVWYNFYNAFSSKTSCRPLQITWRIAMDHRWSADHSLKKTGVVSNKNLPAGLKVIKGGHTRGQTDRQELDSFTKIRQRTKLQNAILHRVVRTSTFRTIATFKGIVLLNVIHPLKTCKHIKN
jgi:hypothetical protein